MDIDELLGKIPIRTDLSPAGHPASLRALAPALAREGTPGARALAFGIDALGAAYDGHGKLLDGVKLAAKEPGQAATLGKTAARIVERASSVLTASQRGIAKERERLQAVFDDAFAAEPKYAAEIRQRLNSLPKEKRLGFVMERIAAGDRDTGLAVLSAPAWLSGLADKDMTGLRDMAERNWLPTERAQRDAIDTMSQHVESAAKTLFATHDDILAKVEAAKESPTAKAIEALAP